MSSILLLFPSGRHRISNILSLIIILFTIKCRTFIVHKNSYHISNYITKNGPSNEIPYSIRSDIKHNSKLFNLEHTHLLSNNENDSEEIDSSNNVKYSPNILALLCDYNKKIKILSELCRLLYESDLNTRLLYVSSSDQQVTDVFETLSQNGFKSKLNLISSNTAEISKNPLVTLGDPATLLGYYNYYNNNVQFKTPENIKYNNDLKDSNSEEFDNDMKSLLGTFFMDNEQISKEPVIYSPKTSLDKEYLESTRNFVDKNYVDDEGLMKLLKGFNKEKPIVIFDDFNMKYENVFNNLNYSFSDNLLALLDKNCSFIGISDCIYNPQNVKNWLTSIFGPFKVVTMNKSPNFQLLSVYGYLNPFTENDEPDFKNVDKLVPSNIEQSYNYFTKKSNLANTRKINPVVKSVLVKAIEYSLKLRGILTYNKLMHYSNEVRDIFKSYVKELNSSPEFCDSPGKLYTVLERVIDLENNNLLSRLIRNLNLYSDFRINQIPSVEYLMTYIKEKNLYPTVIYKFNSDLYEITKEFLSNISNCSNQEYDKEYDNKLDKEMNKEVDNTFNKEMNTDSNNGVVSNLNNKSKPKLHSNFESSLRSNLDFESNFDIDSNSNSNSDLDLDWDLDSGLDKYFDGSEDISFMKNIDKDRRKLLKNGICVLLDKDDDRFKRFVAKNLKKFQIVVSNCPVQSAAHYIFMDSYMNHGIRDYFLSNCQIYSLAQGAELISFILDPRFTIHVLKSILLPIYGNLNLIKHKKYDFYQHSDILTSRLFSSYLKSCRDKYLHDQPDHFQKKLLYDKLDNYFKESNLDSSNIIELERKNKQILDFMNIIKNSLLSKFYFRIKLINNLSSCLDLRGSIVLGNDGSKYKVLYCKENPLEFLRFSNKDVENKFKWDFYKLHGMCSILQNVETSECILVQNKFIRDIISIESPIDSKSKLESKLDSILVENYKYSCIKTQNDLEKYFQVPPIKTYMLFINTFGSYKSIVLSSLLPKFLKDCIFENIEEYESNLQKIEEINRKAGETEELNQEFLKNKPDIVESLSREFVKLEGDLKRDKMEHILKNNRIINSFWGK